MGKGGNAGYQAISSYTSMGERNTVVSAFTLYGHLQQYCSHPSSCWTSYRLKGVHYISVIHFTRHIITKLWIHKKSILSNSFKEEQSLGIQADMGGFTSFADAFILINPVQMYSVSFVHCLVYLA